MNVQAYRVRHWDKHFENHESRKVKSLAWLPLKNKHDGAGYRRVASLPESVDVFCAWVLILQVASKMPVRGLLADGDGPLSAADLGYKIGYPERIFTAAFTAAFTVLSKPEIRWLEPCEIECDGDIPQTHATSGTAGASPQPTGEHREQPGATGRLPEIPGGAGAEQNRREQKYPPPRGHAREDSEIPDEDQAVAMLVTAAVPEDFALMAYREWAMQGGLNANRIPVPWMKYAIGRWKNEQTEWRNGTHRSKRESHPATRGGRPDRNAGTY